MQVHGSLLQLKAVLAGTAELGDSHALHSHLPRIFSAMQAAARLECPAITAECLEVGKAAVCACGGPSQTEGRAALRRGSREDMAQFVLDFRRFCKESLRKVVSASSSGSCSPVPQRALLPVLIESAVSGLLFACTATDKLPRDGGAMAPGSAAPQPAGDQHVLSLETEELDLIASVLPEVQSADLKSMLNSPAVSESQLLCGWHRDGRSTDVLR